MNAKTQIPGSRFVVYGGAYDGLKPIGLQAEILANMFGLSPRVASPRFMRSGSREGAEGLGVIPKAKHLAQLVRPTIKDPENLYLVALARVLEALESRRSLVCDGGDLRLGTLRQSGKTRKFIAELEAETPGDFVVFPVQFGASLAGYSPRLALANIARAGFPLRAFDVGCLLLTHPERISQKKDLGIICGADEVEDGDKRLVRKALRAWRTLCFYADGERNPELVLSSVGNSTSSGQLGAATGYRW